MGSLFSKPKMPEQVDKPTTPMPDPDGPEARAARMKEMLRRRNQSGRQSTLLSGEDYSRDKAGY